MKRIWSIVDNYSEDSEWVQSLYTRAELYLRAIDKLKINSLRHPDNVVATQYMYDFAFLILLITGFFDNLAWLICKIYGIEVKEKRLVREDIIKNDVRLDKLNGERKFIKAVQEKCQSLHDFLSAELTQAKINLVYPIRDSVVHRDYLTAVRYMDVQKKIDAVYLKVSPEISRKFENLIGLGEDIGHCFLYRRIGRSAVTDVTVGNTNVYGASEDMYIIPYEFINMIDKAARGLINGILDIIATSKNQDISNSDSPTGIFEFLGADIEPLYF